MSSAYVGVWLLDEHQGRAAFMLLGEYSAHLDPSS